MAIGTGIEKDTAVKYEKEWRGSVTDEDGRGFRDEMGDGLSRRSNHICAGEHEPITRNRLHRLKAR